jgi:hypothetical protein
MSMPSLPFASHLAGLDTRSLAAMLRARPDMLQPPAPRGFEQLAQRLTAARSLTYALTRIDRDALRVATAAAMTVTPTPARIASQLGATPERVDAVISDLCVRGLAWLVPAEEEGLPSDEPPEALVVALPGALHAHLSEPVQTRRPVAQIARNALVDDVRSAVAALGGQTAGLRKPELITALSELLSDPLRIASVVARLPESAREMLTDLQMNTFDQLLYSGAWISAPAVAKQRQMLVDAGLLLTVNGRPELSREVAAAGLIALDGPGLSGPPDVPRPAVDPAGLRSSAQAAAQEALRVVTTLVDEAAAAPITALKRGGIGGRERQRLAKTLSMPADDLLLWIDLAAAASLLAPVDRREGPAYGPGLLLDNWREDVPARQWAALAMSWFMLPHTSSRRDLDEEKEVPPPLPVDSAAGMLRRAMLRAATGGRSVRLCGALVDWYFPLHDYEGEEREALISASITEAERLGIVAADVLTDLGEALIAIADEVGDLADVPLGHEIYAGPTVISGELVWAASRLGDQCAGLVPETRTSLILQSDLTALVAGSPTPPMARLLRAAAVAESRGAAGTWRFTPASIRGALDLGWRPDDLLTELRALTDHALPQALEYMIGDVARRHGHIAVRGLRSALLADEPTTTELLHTRVLKNLSLARLAPTVLSSPEDPATVLAELRRAGFYPVAEDATGTIILPSGPNPLGPPSATASSPADGHAAAEPRTDRQGGGSRRSAPKTRSAQDARNRAAEARANAASPAARAREIAEESRRLTPEELIESLRRDERTGIPALSPLAIALGKMNSALTDSELTLLAEAVENSGDVVIAYTDKTGSHSVRRIRINSLYVRWLDAHCYLRNAGREFAVANIDAVSPASDRLAPPR